MAARPARAVAADRVAEMERRYREVRASTEALCAPLGIEDQVAQSMPDASPVKWHLAHTTWFFETFVLNAGGAAYVSPEPRYEALFNSYYNSVGEQYARPHRGLLTRPTLDEVRDYRRHVDGAMADLLPGAAADQLDVVEVGLHHEQQHQELILTDVLHLLSCNPLRPAYSSPPEDGVGVAPAMAWRAFAGGACDIGDAGIDFAFDNERPRHRVWLAPFALASRLVTNTEWLAFIDDGGYRRPDLWLSDGWEAIRSLGWRAPLYWEEHDGAWRVFGLGGLRPIAPAEPVCHVSYFEADAYARWAGARLPLEAEWEVAASAAAVEGNLVEAGRLRPAAAPAGEGVTQLFGDAWEWTQSPYTAYPGYRPPPGALGEYNGKFMCDQWVLRGGSCATPRSHIRSTYRNFFPARTRWQFSGVRLARDA
jgi:ergothioneine biosynthesis protein EgtB